MDDLVIPCILRFPGDPPPDLSGFAEPICFPVRVVWRKAATVEPPPKAQPPEPPDNGGLAKTEPMPHRIGNAILRLTAPIVQAQALALVAEEAQGSGARHGEPASGAGIYAYTGNDPLNLSAPSGLCASSLCGNTNPGNSLIKTQTAASTTVPTGGMHLAVYQPQAAASSDTVQYVNYYTSDINNSTANALDMTRNQLRGAIHTNSH
jgi:hypothetical protein